MLLNFIDFRLLGIDPVAFLISLLLAVAIVVPTLAVGIGVHEFSHALAANHFGDSTAKRLGRLSLNPIVHLDPLGTILLLIGGFGWGKPVPVNPYDLRGSVVRGMALVSLAGPASNLIVATIAAMFLRFAPLDALEFVPIWLLLYLVELANWMVRINLVLAVFNMLPIAPLDGFKVALWLLPRELSNSLARTEQYGMAILMLLVGFDFMFHAGIFAQTIGPIISALYRLLVGPI